MAEEANKLTHLDADGGVHMVDVGEKATTVRRAVAEGRVRMGQDLIDQIEANQLAKGNLLEVAKLAGIQAAKRTDQLIPLCHSLPLDHVQVSAWVEAPFVHLRATAQVHGRTGVEMEALTAVSVAALTVIDMGKAVDPTMVIESIRLLEKTGGRRGHFVAPGHEPQEPTSA